MPYYPIFLDLHDKNVLVVGGGKVAERKVQNLLTYGCQINIISPKLTAHLSRLAATGSITRIPRDAIDKTMNDAFMVIAATNDPKVNSTIAAKAKERGLLINAVDQPGDCNFIMPSIVKRGDLHVAISTAGKSPALAKKIRKQMELTFGQEYGAFLKLMGLIRTELLAGGAPSSRNKPVFEKLVNSNLLEYIRKKNMNGIRNTLRSVLGKGFPIDDILKGVSLTNSLQGSFDTGHQPGRK